jgi:hypothetical protein
MAGIVAGDPDDAVGADLAPRLGIGGVVLADMDAVGAGRGGDGGIVVDDEGDVAVLDDGAEAPGGAQEGGLVDVLQAKLDAGHDAADERGGELAGEDLQIKLPRRQLVRRDQIEPAGRPGVAPGLAHSLP